MAVALDEVKEALSADPEYGPAYNVAGLIYAELKEDQLANENFQRALRIDPTESDSNNNYGRFLCYRMREAEAVQYFLAALRNPLYQTPDRSYVNAGLCTLRQGDVAGAERRLHGHHHGVHAGGGDGDALVGDVDAPMAPVIAGQRLAHVPQIAIGQRLAHRDLEPRQLAVGRHVIARATIYILPRLDLWPDELADKAGDRLIHALIE